jgi:hypothetical protein
MIEDEILLSQHFAANLSLLYSKSLYLHPELKQGALEING